MKHSIATVSLSGTLDVKLRAIANAGFAAVEIFENDLLTCPLSAREVGTLTRSLGLQCLVFQPFRDFEGMPDEARARVFSRAERKFDVAQELGTQLLLVCSNVSPAALADRQRIVDDFRELGERAAKRGLLIGYEALAWGRHVYDHRDAWAIVKAVDHPSVGLILDTFHSLARAVPIDSLRWIEAGKIFLVQVADAPALNMDPLSWSRHFRCMPGQGDLPLTDYVATLAEIGYAGPLSLEIFNDRFRAGSPVTVAIDGARSLTLLEDELRRRLGAARHVALITTPALPPKVRCSGMEFIEFCANEAEARYLGDLLRSLGFIMAGRHHSKAVERWRQGTINLVINYEAEGFAHAFDAMHGASVCAIGLRVDDLANAMVRAQRLGIEVFSRLAGPGDVQMPAVHGVGGSLIYFMQQGATEDVWEREFRPHAGADAGADAGAISGAGLLQVDHISQAMQYEEMLSWLLYYLALFDVHKAPLVEIADPVGLVLSQAIQSEDGALRMTLNGSAAAQTLPSRFLHAYLGAGVQHMAFATADIFAAAQRLRSSGMEVLPIPGNYYDDLEARFGLREDVVNRMRDFNILYDRDGDGEYWQLYSRAFAKRFFCEIVQRRNYHGYGAANAAIRLAAQSRYKNDPPVPQLGTKRGS